MKSKAVRDLDAFGNIQKRHETCREIKAAMNCRNPKYWKAPQGRAAILKRRETRRNPKYNKAARGRAALRNILKRQ